MNKTLVAALAAVAGGIVGAGVALLYAPECGARQRRKIKVVVGKGARVSKEEIDKTIATVKAVAGKYAQLSKEQMDELVASLRSALCKKSCGEEEPAADVAEAEACECAEAAETVEVEA